MRRPSSAASARPPYSRLTTWPWKYIEFCEMRVSKPPVVRDTAVAYGMCVCSTQRAVARDWCTPRWIMNADVSHSPSPSTTLPSRSIVRMSDARSSDQCGP